MRFSLSEDATSSYTAVYSDYINDIQGVNIRMSNIFESNMQSTKYDVLQRLISRISEVYSEVIQDDINSGLVNEWEDSEASLVAFLRNYHAGESAEGIGSLTQTGLEDIMIDTLRIDRVDAILTDRPVVSDAGLQELKDACRNSMAEIEEIKERYRSKIDDEYEENEIFGTLIPLIDGVSAKMINFLDGAGIAFDNLHEFVLDNAQKMRNIVEEENGLNKSADAGGTSGGGGAGSEGGNGDSKGASGSGANDDKKDKKKEIINKAKEIAKKYGSSALRVIAAGLPDLMPAEPFGKAGTGISKMLSTLADEIEKGTKSDEEKNEDGKPEDKEEGKSEKKEGDKSEKKEDKKASSKRTDLAAQLAAGIFEAMGIPVDILGNDAIKALLGDNSQDMVSSLLGYLFEDGGEATELSGELGYDLSGIKKDVPADVLKQSAERKKISNAGSITGTSAGSNSGTYTGSNTGINAGAYTGTSIGLNAGINAVSNAGSGTSQKSKSTHGKVNPGQMTKTMMDTVSLLGDSDPYLAGEISKSAPKMLQMMEKNDPIVQQFWYEISLILSPANGANQSGMDSMIVDTIMGNDDYRMLTGLDGDTAKKSGLCQNYMDKHQMPKLDYPQRPSVYKGGDSDNAQKANADDKAMLVDKGTVGQACTLEAAPFVPSQLMSEVNDITGKSADNNLKGYVELPENSQLKKAANQINGHLKNNGLPSLFDNKDGRYNAKEIRLLCDEMGKEFSKNGEPDFGKAISNTIRKGYGYPGIDSNGVITISEIQELIPVLDDKEAAFRIGKNDIIKLISNAFRLNDRNDADTRKQKILDDIQNQNPNESLLMTLIDCTILLPVSLLGWVLGAFGSYPARGNNDNESNAYSYLVKEIGKERTESLLKNYVLSKDMCRLRNSN
jgi:hypothetical protein